jgi:hypothetical protein
MGPDSNKEMQRNIGSFPVKADTLLYQLGVKGASKKRQKQGDKSYQPEFGISSKITLRYGLSPTQDDFRLTHRILSSPKQSEGRIEGCDYKNSDSGY